MIITCGQVPFVSWYSPGGFNTMRSAPDSASDIRLQIYLETLGWGTYLAQELNDITFFCFFPFSLSLFFFLFVNFLLPKWGSSAWIKIWLTLTIWCMDLRSVAGHNHLNLFYSCTFLNLIHFSPTTWTEWHHLGLHLIISSSQLW